MAQCCGCDCGHRSWDGQSENGAVDASQRLIRPLPAKQSRVPSAPLPPPGMLTGVTSNGQTGAQDYSSESDADDEDIDDRHIRSARAERRLRQISKEADAKRQPRQTEGVRPAARSGSWAAATPGGPPSQFPDRLADEAHDGSTHTSNSHDHESTNTESPPTSPASVSPRLKASRPDDVGGGSVLFGDEGRRIVDSLASASSFSPAGLFGGLGLATLHPSLTPSGGERERDDIDDDDYLDGDEDTYGVVDRNHPPVEPTAASQQAAMALVVGAGGSNKKKRKIPGIAEVRETPLPVAEDDAEGNASSLSAGPPIPTTLPSDPRELFADKGLLAPLNPPRTAEAALAKWRLRPPHVSLCPSCYSSRRARRKRFRRDDAKAPPISLPSAPRFVPPAQPREGPPRLPPGSGAKGSKAIKLAMKAAKEREKEKDRIRKLFGIVLLPPEIWENDNPSPREVTEAIKKDLDRRRRTLAQAPSVGSPPDKQRDADAPSQSSDLLLSPHPPNLDLFTFVQPATEVIESRWTALNEQKVRLRAAKERAAKARAEEERRRKEKEARDAEAPAAALPDTAQPAPNASQPGAQAVPGPAPATKSTATGQQKPARPPTHAAAPPTATKEALPTQKAAVAQTGPEGPPPAAPLPPIPAPPVPASTRKAPPKKGKKKRSAHANALNVHHRDNYVPSRSPAPGAAANEPPPRFMSWPASEEALASAGPYASTCGGGHFCGPDEWLCLFCEYELFYGEESLLYKAIGRRKNVLKVRKKAQDRANKAAHGAIGSNTAQPEASAPRPPVPAPVSAPITPQVEEIS